MELQKYSIFIIVAFLLILFVFLRSLSGRKTKGEIKGEQGERMVAELLRRNNYKHYNDVLLEIGTHTTQIDHLVISPDKTIIVIETKNKDGLITGNEQDQYWTQKFKNTQYQFYNPVKQNEGHINFLKRFFKYKNYEEFNYVNLVVFTTRNNNLRNAPSNVLHISELESHLDFHYTRKFWNRSRHISRLIRQNNQSRNKRKVKQHKKFAQNAHKYTKK